jgi:hypothetical protein
MQEVDESLPRLGYVEPYEGESISHYLGRLRRFKANSLIPLNINQSPFNVGIPSELPPLTESQVMDLVRRHGLNWREAEVAQLMAMVGGHPYLDAKAS